MHIALDFDEVLFPFVVPFIDWARAEQGMEPWQPDFKQLENCVVDLRLVGVTTYSALEDLFVRYYASKELLKVRPLIGAVECVNNLLKEHKLTIITSRTVDDKKATERQLWQYFPRIPIEFTGQRRVNKCGATAVASTSKHDVCLREKVQVHFDDNVYVANACALNGVPAVLMQKPWKFTVPIVDGVKCVQTWVGFMQHVASM